MGCLITTRLPVIAIGVGFGPPGWLYRKRGEAGDHQIGCDVYRGRHGPPECGDGSIKRLRTPEFRYGYRTSMVAVVAAGVC